MIYETLLFARYVGSSNISTAFRITSKNHSENLSNLPYNNVFSNGGVGHAVLNSGSTN